ncbi:non-ribosomal peptide synthetase [Streptomyces sp. ISID311]|uniref:non-ribosomal peptide synthetase n=1 Tax=Streptomyces sp. ISID311 TaxID=2601673 RepID=UPI0011BD3147|nr:non-ribosomal peptide synthetase [Streptomyces sp. ISID311]TXC99818.1 amino acid adenylation domain-containing protein [Streptomyces sp. ISID311]
MLTDSTDPATAETTDLEALRTRLAAILDLPPGAVRDDDNLIALGLDSINLMKLAARWRRAGADVTFGALAADPTPDAWHALLSARLATDTPAAPEPVTAPEAGEEATGPFPLALMQHAYWAGRSPGQRLGGVAAHFYHEFDGTGVHPDRLRTAVRSVLARHDMLRVRILDDGTQEVLDTAAWPGPRVTDLRHESPEAAEAALERLRGALSHRAMDIGAGEVFDVGLTLLPDGRTRTHVNLDMIAADALSLRILLADLADAYTAGGQVPRAKPAYSFRRYLSDREAHLAGPGRTAREADRAWWQDRLDTLPGAPELPAAGHDADATTVVRRHRTLSRERAAAFEARARAHGLTPALALTAVFAEVLTAWSTEPSFLLNLPLFDREPLHPDVDDLVGDFTSSTLLAWDGTAPGTFADRAGRLQERFHSDAAHARHSGVEVLRDLSRRRGAQTLAPVVHTSALGLGPLFPASVTRVFGEPVWIISQGPQVWLDAQITELDGGVLVNWDAREAAFTPGVLDAMFAAYGGLLDRLTDDDSAWTSPVGDLLPPEQRHTRQSVNDTGRPPGTGLCLHDEFFRHAATAPDAPALLRGSGTDAEHYTYGGLASRALAVAGHLHGQGVRPGDLVAVSLPKGPEQAVAVLGVLAAGAAYLPIAVDQPPARRARILKSAGARLLLDNLDTALTAAPLPAPVPGSPDDLAYVLYTSGSTGEPKGVEVAHAAAMCTVADLRERLGLGPTDRTLALSALEFDLSVFDLFAPLSTGGAVVCVQEPERRDADAWLRLAHTHRATVLNCVPVLLDMLLTVAEAEATDATGPRPLPLRAVLLGGDRVTTDLAERLALRAPDCRFVGLGGTTETAIHSTWQEVTLPVPGDWHIVPYGRPLNGVRCRVVDALGRDCPDGVPGELWIGGGGVARGYRGDPDRTADRFVDHDGVRWYRTGDRARYRPDGGLDFLGRTDHQVKVRGHRIELGEVEAALAAHPDVAKAVAVLLPNHRLAAAVVPAPGRLPSPARLKEHLGTLLPPAMIPDATAVLCELPLTRNGKTDRAAVTARLTEVTAADAGPVGPDCHEPPRTDAERLVAAAWKDVLGIPEPGPGRADDFFVLGGDSLMATRLLTRLRADGVQGTALSALFAHPVLADFAETVHLGPARPPAQPPAPAPEHRHDPFPPTDVQLAYWLGRGAEFTLGGVSCHFYREYDIPGLDVARLEEAVNRLITRHDMLRAVFDADGNQRVLADTPRFAVHVTDAGPDPDAARAALRDTWSHHVFDPGRWPLFSVAAVRDGRRVRLAVGMDNLVLDALSILTFYSELSALYADPEAELPPVDVSFRDHVLAARPDPDEREAAERHWEQRLDTLPAAPRLPLACDPADIARPRFARRTAVLDAAARRALEERARAHGVTPSAVLLTAYCETLSLWSSERDLTVNLTLFDRREAHPHITRVLGDFTSLVLVGHEHHPDEAWLTGARRTQRELWQALDHRSLSAVQVLRRLARRTGQADVTMPVVFTSALGLDVGEDKAGLFTDQVYGITQTPQVWLDHQAVERRTPDGTVIDLHWDAVEDLFPEGVLDAMFEAYTAHLRSLLEADWNVPRPVRLPPAQRTARDRANDTAAVQRETCLHAPFFRNAALRPDAPAILVAGTDRSVTYYELSLRARRIAALLAAHDVAPGEPVAVCLPKGPDQIAAVLGVLAAGAAYVPVGVDQPRVRRDRILTGAGVRLALAADTAADWPVTTLPLTEADRYEPLESPAVAAPDQLAYVIFTSGSTGDPKGVEITHGAAANTVEDINDRYAVGADDCVLAVSALDFDLSVYDVFGLLSAGGALVTVAEDERRDAQRWADLCVRHGVTVWNTVPALLDMLLTVAEHQPHRVPGELRLALLSGDWIGLDLPGRLSALVPSCQLVGLGGATEAAIWSNAHDVEGPLPGWPSIPYGRPLRNQSYRVVDPRGGADRPDWVTGELWIGGVGLARGYCGAPDMTSARFVTAGGRRWYRTGDLGRYRPGGLLEFLGRTDDQVKIRGHRIELGEIEAALAAHPDVARAAVAVSGTGAARELVTAVVPADGCESTALPMELRHWLEGQLPLAMVPRRIATLPAIPLTANGKVDRRSVTAAVAATADRRADQSAPARELDPGERSVVRLWESVLDLPVRTPEDNFFTLGGDSVKAVRLVERAVGELGVRLSLADFFARPTVGTFADLARTQAASVSEDAESMEEGVL